ncbi:glycosyltransferase family 4 protein [uncultured Methanomethylovorans sp.]|uniref:glycosyltransferase family 4 protein n=1 Tax=uncultured Methanomethylovorans sp. TaxID=183759 RepID=UPI002AA5FAC8|nr:glycosyltransferase family 4 protein [uncultured Methanomethylovorans sp.]
MHICIIAGEFPPHCAGIGNYAYNLARKLIDHGHKVTVFTRGDWKNCCSIENVDGIIVHRIRFIPIYPFHVDLHGIFLNRKFKILESSFDLVHVHSPLIPVVRTRLPLVLTEHGTTKSDIENSVSSDFHSKLIRLLSKKLISLDIKAIENSDQITAVSHSCANDINRAYNINRKITVVNNGVDTNYFTPNSNNDRYNTTEPYILYTGRLDSRKGLVDLIESAKYICAKYPRMKFVLIGKGPNREYLEQKVKEMKLEQNILFTGFVEKNILLKYYQNAQIYVFPSYFEGLPTTLLEAMSCGLPVIATDVAGNSEVIKNGENGLLVSQKAPLQIAEAMIKLLSDDMFRFEIGLAARAHVIENYDWEIISNKIEEIYNDIKQS